MYKIFIIFFFLLIGPLKAEQFRSIKGFTFELPDGYKIFNKNIVYDSFVNFEQTLVSDRKIVSNKMLMKLIRLLDLIYLNFSNFVKRTP